MGVTLPTQEEYDTIGGMVLSCLHTIPKDGTTVDVEVNGLSLHAEKIVGRRIESVLVKKLDPEHSGSVPSGESEEHDEKKTGKAPGKRGAAE